YAAEAITRGATVPDVERSLVRQGLTPEEAAAAVEHWFALRFGVENRARERNARRRFWAGVVLTAIGGLCFVRVFLLNHGLDPRDARGLGVLAAIGLTYGAFLIVVGKNAWRMSEDEEQFTRPR